jgi:hypothetical protein
VVGFAEIYLQKFDEFLRRSGCVWQSISMDDDERIDGSLSIFEDAEADGFVVKEDDWRLRIICQ